MLPPDFKNCETLKSYLNKDVKSKITQARCLQISNDDPNILRLRENSKEET